MFAALPLLSSAQLLLGIVSPKISEPIVRALSRCSVLLTARFSVLKSAMPSAPFATIPPDQFVVVDQSSAPLVAVQMPLVAWANEAHVSIANSANAIWRQ